jgi:hypothetical protein
MDHSITRLGVVTLGLLLSACAPTASNMASNGGTSQASNPNFPGATGTTVVRGNNSTIAGDANATYNQQKWPMVPSP